MIEEVEDKIVDSMLSDEELLDIVMSVTPAGAPGAVKNIFKLGAKGLKQARQFIQLFSAQNQRNPKAIELINGMVKKYGISITKIKDMAKKRSALESSKYKGKYYPKTDKYKYE